MWYSRSFTSPAAPLRMTEGNSVQDDTGTLLFRMTRKGFVYGDKKCLSERSEESEEEGRDNGPRTS